MYTFKENLLDKCEQRLIGKKQVLAEKLAEVRQLRQEISGIELLQKTIKETNV